MARQRGFLLSLGLIAVSVSMTAAGLTPATADTEAKDEMSWTDDFDRADSGSIGKGWAELRGDWAVSGGALRSVSGPPERIAAHTGFALGKTFTIDSVLQIDDSEHRRWNGVAFNITDNPDGTQNYYAFRLVNAAEGRPGAWQLLQVTNSVIDTSSLIDQGSLPIVGGRDYTVRVSSTTYGVVEAAVLDGDAELLDRPMVVPLGRLLAGGYSGFYSLGGNLRVDRVRVTTSTKPADPPRPGPLQCTPVQGPPYELPDEQEEVVGKSVVDTTWAGHPVGQSVLTTGTDQYVAYYNSDRQLVVAQRKTDSTAADPWTRQPLDTSVGWDSHNYVTMALDRDGNLHVSGNMHGVPLIYFRTTVPGNVQSLARVQTMVDPATEQRVTYPVFVRTPAGELVFRYRDGASGSGSDLYNIYDENTDQWRRLLDRPLHDGEGLRNAYVNGPVLGPDNYYHLVWVWRDSPDAATNQRLSYARSRDLVHWEKSNGSPLTLPITFDSGEAVDPVPMNGGIINGNTKIGFDSEGRVLITYHKYDKQGNTQIYLARREATRWKLHQVSDWTGRWTIGGFGTLQFEVRHGSVSVLPDGNLRLDFTCHGVQRTWVLDPRSLDPIAEVDSPQLPAELTTVRSDFPEMQVNLGADISATGTADQRYLLRWESLPSNQDRPRDPPLPEPGPLEVYLLRR